MRNVENKYPGLGEAEQKESRQAAERQLKKDAAAIGLGVKLPGDTNGKGCLFFIVILFALLAALTHMLATFTGSGSGGVALLSAP